jgi:hypothetical protein
MAISTITTVEPKIRFTDNMLEAVRWEPILAPFSYILPRATNAWSKIAFFWILQAAIN